MSFSYGYIPDVKDFQLHFDIMNNSLYQSIDRTFPHTGGSWESTNERKCAFNEVDCSNRFDKRYSGSYFDVGMNYTNQCYYWNQTMSQNLNCFPNGPSFYPDTQLLHPQTPVSYDQSSTSPDYDNASENHWHSYHSYFNNNLSVFPGNYSILKYFFVMLYDISIFTVQIILM